MRSLIEPGQFARPEGGPRFQPRATATSGSDPNRRLPYSLEPGWQSNGGPARHPSRTLPFVLDVPIATAPGRLVRLHLVGVFALMPESEGDPEGTLGAQVMLAEGERVVMRQDLIAGRHYGSAASLKPVLRLNGDGTGIETLGETVVDGHSARVDLLTIDVIDGIEPTHLRFKDSGTAASFVLFDVFFEVEAKPVCPFRGSGGGVSLAEVGAIVRVADRVRFARAMRQLEHGILAADDLDEARSLSLTFLAVVSAALLEMGGSREMHRLQLRAARTLDQLESNAEIAEATKEIVDEIVSPILHRPTLTGDALIDRALGLIERHFGKDLQDFHLAEQLGLSTSHFRFLFKQATGRPFHKYLVSLRLEKARQMLLDQDLSVAEIARLVGFTSPAHFSRAFQKRFSTTPSALRQARRS